jgi:hypothetical protein
MRPLNVSECLYFETPTSLPLDFHSFRRAFNTALAAAGVNVQKAMKLAGHSNAATHMRYVMQTPDMRTIPTAALPNLEAVAIRCDSPRSRANHRGAEGEAEEDEDEANRVKSSVCVDSQRPNKPLLGDSNTLGFTENHEPAADQLQRAVAEPAPAAPAPHDPAERCEVAPPAEPSDAAVPSPVPPPSGSTAASSALVDVVDAALAAALERAAAAGEWSTAATLAGELAARRAAREANPNGAVVDLAAEQRKRGGR